jgi:hypothetical protein
MYLGSAELTAWLADAYGIPKTRDYIFGHGEAPDCSDHTDPGPGWDWDKYMDFVLSGGDPIYGATEGANNYPTTMVSGEEGVAWFELVNDSNYTWDIDNTRLGTQDPQDRASPFYVDGNWLAQNRATGADHSDYAPGTTGRFTFAIRAPDVDTETTFTESFQLVQEGESWFGPIVQMTITVTPSAGGGDDDDDPIGPNPFGDDEITPSGGESGDGTLNGGCNSTRGPAAASWLLLLLGALPLLLRRHHQLHRRPIR